MNKEYWWEDKDLYYEFKKRKKDLLKEMREKFAVKYGKSSGAMESGGTLMNREPR